MNRWLSRALFLWAATQANASEQLLCRFPSTEDGKLFETLKIDVPEDEEVSVLHVWEPRPAAGARLDVGFARAFVSCQQATGKTDC